MGDGDFRDFLQIPVPQIDTRHQSDYLPGHGLDDRLLPPAVHQPRFDAPRDAHCAGRPALHARRMVLRPQGLPLSPHGVASAD